MSEFRKYGRRAVKCSIRLTHQELGDIIAETRDISDAGVFISHRDLVHYISVGEKIKAKFYSEENKAFDGFLKVIRLTTDGVGLEYL